MNHVRITTTVALMLMLAALPGCSSKKDKADQAQQQQQATPTTPPKAGEASPKVAVTASPKDEADAAILKAKVLAHVKAGEFAAIYKEASDGFRKVGPEDKFVGLWQQQLQQTGAFKEAKEVSHTIRAEDKFLVFIYEVRYEKAKKGLRLTFGRLKNGKLELTGINQRDIK
jgi:hypothetical protein